MNPKISLIQVPYQLGRARVGRGSGPLRYLQAGAERELLARGFTLRVETVEADRACLPDELSAVASINARLAACVRSAVAQGYFPLVLGGDCNTCLGTLAGLGSSSLGVVWFDAHGDFNTPETSPSGSLDGMPLAIATGQCHESLRERIGDYGPVPEANVLLVGVRDLDPKEREHLTRSSIHVLAAGQPQGLGLSPELLPKLTELRSLVREVYLHLDVDVLDPLEAPGVDFRSPNGLTSAGVAEAIRMIAGLFRVRAAAIAAYNPERDEDDRTARAGLRLLTAVAEAVADRSRG